MQPIQREGGGKCSPSADGHDHCPAGAGPWLGHQISVAQQRRTGQTSDQCSTGERRPRGHRSSEAQQAPFPSTTVIDPPVVLSVAPSSWAARRQAQLAWLSHGVECRPRVFLPRAHCPTPLLSSSDPLPCLERELHLVRSKHV